MKLLVPAVSMSPMRGLVPILQATPGVYAIGLLRSMHRPARIVHTPNQTRAIQRALESGSFSSPLATISRYIGISRASSSLEPSPPQSSPASQSRGTNKAHCAFLCTQFLPLQPIPFSPAQSLSPFFLPLLPFFKPSLPHYPGLAWADPWPVPSMRHRT